MTNFLHPIHAASSSHNVAQLCILLADVMDTYVASQNGPVALTPEILPGTDLSKDWDILGYLVANQAIHYPLALDPCTVFFGVLAKAKGHHDTYAVLLRGTEGWREWVDNAHVMQTDFPVPALPGACAPGAMVCFPSADCGDVEQGFFGIYSSMRYLSVKGGESKKAWEGISEAVKEADALLYVAGHSMGAALATYLTFDLAQHAGRQASGVFIASPRPGDDDFAKAFDAAVLDYAVYDYVKDLVPDLPPTLLGYQPLPRLVQLTELTAQAVIKDEVRANHHALCYAAMLDYPLRTPEQWKALLVRDDCEADCIQGAAPMMELAA
jgi:hypothetical protein